MKKFGLLAIAGAAFVALAQPAAAQDYMGKTLWTNLNFGMSQADVLAAQPTATKPKKPEVGSDKAVCALELQGYNVINRFFHVCMFFNNEDKLVRVTLERKPSTNGDFEDIRNQLRAKYGQESEAQLGNSMLSFAKWHGETNTVILMLQKNMWDPRFGNIIWVYREPMPSENDKL